jgi:hypothetical protein
MLWQPPFNANLLFAYKFATNVVIRRECSIATVGFDSSR